MENFKEITFFEYMKNDAVKTISEIKDWILSKYQIISDEVVDTWNEYQQRKIKNNSKNAIKIPVRPHLMYYFYKHGAEIFTYFLAYFAIAGFFLLALKNVQKSYVMIPLLIFSFSALAYLILKTKDYIRRWSK